MDTRQGKEVWFASSEEKGPKTATEQIALSTRPLDAQRPRETRGSGESLCQSMIGDNFGMSLEVVRLPQGF